MPTKHPEAEPIERNLDELADAIEQLSQVGELLAKSKLKERAILLLLSNMTGLGQRDVKEILYALPQLRAAYLK